MFDRARRAALGLIRFWRDLGDRNFNLVSAGVAFFAMLAVFPAIAAIIALWGFWADPVFVLAQIELVSDVLPSEAFLVVEAQVGQLVAANSSTLGITSLLSLVAAAWSARRGVAAMMMGLNAIHGVPPRGGVAHALRAQLLTLMLISVALVALACFLVLPLLLAVFPIGPATTAALLSTRWAIALGTLAMGLAILYRFGPNYRPGQRIVILPGLVMAMVIWAGASVAFSVFLSNFGNYNEVYGSIGAAVALMMWFYLSAYAVLLGAALNAEILRADQ